MKLLRTLTLGLLGSLLAFSAYAKDGYKIKVKFTDKSDTLAYLAHYFGKPLPTIYKTDSARFDKNGVATFESSEPVLGGIYIIMLSDKATYFEFLLDNGADMSITATASKLPLGLTFKNSPENERFQEYVGYLQNFGEQQKQLQLQLEMAKSAKDTADIRAKAKKQGQSLMEYRRDYAQKHPGTLLTNIFKALETPQVPEGEHLLPDGAKDTSFAYRYYKDHYWDGFNFKDDRLIHTPIYDAKLDEYFNKLVVPVTDSMEKEADWILAQTRGRKELFKYTLWWLTRNVETSKIMGMDEVFVYLVENYYMKGDAYWLDREALEKYYDRARKIAPNLIGNVAPEIKMQDIKGKVIPLSSVKAKYTVIAFWDPTCGHCMKEMPALDSLYKKELKKRGVKIYGVRTEGPEDKWQEAIKEHPGMEEWINVYDPNNTSDFRSKYDIYSTPVIYLLDENKIIRGKRLDHSNLLEVIEMLERQKAASPKS